MSDFIQHVSDTSFWVAHYRAIESARPDALFNDPYAHLLVGDRADSIDKLISQTTKWTQWTLVMRTVVIDQMIRDLIAKGVTTFLNIGAGLDTRPYRMNLGPNIKWIEMDFDYVLDHKKSHLKNIQSTCQLESIALDLSNRELRQSHFTKIATANKQIAVITEGVLLYLTQDQVSELSEDLLRHSSFTQWIGEYISPKSYPYLKNPKRMKTVKNSPFKFFPEDWMGFFESRGWKLAEAQYFIDISEKHKRSTPMPKFFKVLEFIKGPEWALPFKRMSGFLMWEQS